jgi:hypothetical protein
VQLEGISWFTNWKEFRKKRPWPKTISYPGIWLQRKLRISVAALEEGSTMKRVSHECNSTAWSLGLSYSPVSWSTACVPPTLERVIKEFYIYIAHITTCLCWHKEEVKLQLQRIRKFGARRAWYSPTWPSQFTPRIMCIYIYIYVRIYSPYYVPNIYIKLIHTFYFHHFLPTSLLLLF